MNNENYNRTYDLVTIGETLGVFGTNKVGTLINGSAMTFRIAGAESNIAIGMSRLGKSTHWLSVLGNDPVAHVIRRELRAEGVVVSAATDPDHPTAVMMKVLRTGSLTSVQYFRENSAFAHSTPDSFDFSGLTQTRCFHFSGISLALGDGPVNAVRTGIEIARRHGALISFDLNYRSTMWDRDKASSVLGEFIGLADIVFASPDEASLVVPLDDPVAMAQSVRERGAQISVIKLGPDGALAADAETHFTSSAIATPVVDVIGAGDAFASGFLSSWLDDSDLQKALSHGNRAAAFAISAPGDWDNLPNEQEFRMSDFTTDVIR